MLPTNTGSGTVFTLIAKSALAPCNARNDEMYTVVSSRLSSVSAMMNVSTLFEEPGTTGAINVNTGFPPGARIPFNSFGYALLVIAG